MEKQRQVENPPMGRRVCVPQEDMRRINITSDTSGNLMKLYKNRCPLKIKDEKMKSKKILKGKKILIVDDEPIVLASLTKLLDICRIDTASFFEDGKQLLENQEYDVVILGVKGFDLLEISKTQNIPALMLTAHVLSEGTLNKSAKKEAAYFVPKNKMHDIDIFVSDVLEAIEPNKNTWEKWFSWLGDFFDKRFHGTEWREQEKKFWGKKAKIPW